MSSIPSITTSILTGMRTGFGMLDRGAEEVVQGTLPDSGSSNGPAPAASVSVGNPVGGTGDEVLSGVRDLMMARLQIGGSAALLHAYSEDRSDLFEMLRP